MNRYSAIILFFLLGCFLMTLPPSNARSEAQTGGFASDRVPTDQKPLEIDGDRAMKYLREICAFGPRMSGTPAMTKQQEFLQKHFEKLGGKVTMQSFTAKQISQRNAPVAMKNMIISWFPERKRRVIICSHYDTRPIADQERDPRKWREPFVSANDGGSGVAFLMELAHHVKALDTKVGIDFVLFDGEEYIWNSDRDEYFFGSKHFANEWRKDKNRPAYVGAVLLDMIAGKNVRFPAEGHSYTRARNLTVQLWNIAQELRCQAFQQRVGDYVQDDHLALQRVGIPACDIIDFSYPHWHRLSDTPDNCAPDGMIQVGKVLSVWIQRTK